MSNPINKISTSQFPTAEYISTGPDVLRARPAASAPRISARPRDLNGGR